MSLDQLNQQLYDPNSQEIAEREHSADQFDPAAAGASPNPFEKEEQWGKYQQKMDAAKKKKILLVCAIIFSIVALIAGVTVYRIIKSKAFFEDRVALAFQGPKEADSTQPVKYKLNFKNDNKVTLKDVEIILTYPENFQPTNNVNLKILNSTSSKFVLEDDIKPRSEGSVELNGVFFAPKDFPLYLRADMKYVPSNGSKDFTVQGQYSVTISSSPVALDLVTAPEVSDGDVVEYVIDYKNPDTRPLKDIKIKVAYPDGFSFMQAEPVATENDSTWYVGILDSQQGGKIKIRGVQHGLKDETKTIKVSLGYVGKDGGFIVFAQKEQSIKITMPLLSITQSLQGVQGTNIGAGDSLTYVIKYQNNGDIGMRDAIVTAAISGSVLDFTKLSAEKGSFDAEKGLVSWRAADVPALANIEPKATGELRFSVPVKSNIPVQTANDKNFQVISVAKIDSPDIPTTIGANKIIGSNKLTLKLSSKTFLDVTGFYKDAQIQNSGPLPAKVGNSTTFVLHLAVASISNDLAEVKVATSLPAGIEWTGKIFPGNERVTFNERTRELVWIVGNVGAGTGALVPKKEVSFQVSIKPQVNQVGQFFKLLNKAVLTGKDVFTGEEVLIESPEKDSQLREDTSINVNDYKIQGP